MARKKKRKEISYNELMIFALAAFIVSVFSTVSILGSFGGITGAATGDVNVTVSSDTTISVHNTDLNFGSIAVGTHNDTIDNDPPPFYIRNDGSVAVNITINASQLWTTVATTDSSYMFNSTDNESNSAVDLYSFTDMPIGSSPVNLTRGLNYNNSKDEVTVHINLTVPTGEPNGAKNSTVEFTATAA